MKKLFLSLLLVGCTGEGPLIDTIELPMGRIQLEYLAELEASGEELYWELVEGSLPSGLQLAPEGQISGYPVRSGIYEFSIAVSNNGGTDIMDYYIEIPPVVLLSGFGPFQDTTENPSIEAIRDLDQQMISGLDVRVIEIPVLWEVAWELLEEEIERLNPTYVIATGQASGSAMRYEEIARNVQYGTDNDGVRRSGTEVVSGGPDTYVTTLPIKDIMHTVNQEGIATEKSSDAGSYLCNDIFYHVMHYTDENSFISSAGFVHVPDSGLSLEEIQYAQVLAIETLASKTKRLFGLF